MPDLTDFQLEVTGLFFSLPASKGFLLAGGAALLAQHLTTRPTEDLDFFTAPDRGHVPATRWKPQHGSGAGPPSASTTATHSAGAPGILGRLGALRFVRAEHLRRLTHGRPILDLE